jgi:hypothetical protein
VTPAGGVPWYVFVAAGGGLAILIAVIVIVVIFVGRKGPAPAASEESLETFTDRFMTQRTPLPQTWYATVGVAGQTSAFDTRIEETGTIEM